MGDYLTDGGMPHGQDQPVINSPKRRNLVGGGAIYKTHPVNLKRLRQISLAHRLLALID